jgi:hypothetical protein
MASAGNSIPDPLTPQTPQTPKTPAGTRARLALSNDTACTAVSSNVMAILVFSTVSFEFISHLPKNVVLTQGCQPHLLSFTATVFGKSIRGRFYPRNKKSSDCPGCATVQIMFLPSELTDIVPEMGNLVIRAMRAAGVNASYRMELYQTTTYPHKQISRENVPSLAHAFSVRHAEYICESTARTGPSLILKKGNFVAEVYPTRTKITRSDTDPTDVSHFVTDLNAEIDRVLACPSVGGGAAVAAPISALVERPSKRSLQTVAVSGESQSEQPRQTADDLPVQVFCPIPIRGSAFAPFKRFDKAPRLE